MFGDDTTNTKSLAVPDQITESSLREHLKEAAAVLTRTAGDQTATARAVDDLSGKLQGMIEASARPQQRAAVGVKDRELQHRYCDESGRIHLKGVNRRVKFAGQVAEVYQPGLLDDTEAQTPWHLELQKAVERRSLVRLMAKNPATPRTDAEIIKLMSRAPQNIRGAIEKAITDTAGSGAEWIPDGTYPSIYEEFKVPLAIAGLFPIVDMPRATMLQPKLSTGVRPFKRNAITSDDPANYTGSTPVTAEQTITVSNMAVRVVYDTLEAEDAIVALEPLVRRLVVDALNDGYSDAMINGHTAGTQDTISAWNIRGRWGASGLGGSADHRRLFDGMRRIAIARSQNVDMGSTQTVSGLMSSLIGGMGERAASRLAIIVSPEVFYQKLLADTNVLTLDKLGAGATLLSGQLASVFGHPIVVSRFLSADLNGSGVFDNATKDKSGAIAVDLTAFSHYQRQGAIVELDRDVKTGGTHVVATLRRCFKTVSGSNEAVVRFGFNWLS